MARRTQTTSALAVLRPRRPVVAFKRVKAPTRPTPSSQRGIFAHPTMLRPGGLNRGSS